MKKAIPFVVVLPFLLFAFSCDSQGDLASLDVFNSTGQDIVKLSLEGEESTGNVLKNDIKAEAVETKVVEVEPGSYTWRAENEDGDEFDGDIDMFPGRNNLVID